MKYRSVFLPAKLATYEKDTFFSGTVTETTDCYIDGKDLAQRCEELCNAMAADGYDIVSITETTRGGYNIRSHAGAGWSMTHGLIITGRRE